MHTGVQDALTTVFKAKSSRLAPFPLGSDALETRNRLISPPQYISISTSIRYYHLKKEVKGLNFCFCLGNLLLCFLDLFCPSLYSKSRTRSSTSSRPTARRCSLSVAFLGPSLPIFAVCHEDEMGKKSEGNDSY